MKLVATLACRNNSSRLFAKPLQPLTKSASVLEYMIARLKERPEIHAIVLAISEAAGNEVYKDVALRNNIEYVFGDDRDVLSRLIKACRVAGGDTVFRVTTESPFPYLEELPSTIESHTKQNADYTVIRHLPDGVMFELIKLEALERSHEYGEKRHRSELCTLYINENREKFRVNILDVPENLRRPSYRLTIDYPEDLILCRKIAQNLRGENRYIPYVDIISYLDSHPNERKIVENLTDDTYFKPYE
jgi:spore coat polysaccharide biosynthesis protein SpsF